jgi:hypothetical protein
MVGGREEVISDDRLKPHLGASVAAATQAANEEVVLRLPQN